MRAGLGTRVIAAVQAHSPHRLLPFHRAWLRAVFAPGCSIGVLSVPRGNAKSWLAAQLLGLTLRPGSPLFDLGLESLLVSASMGQSRVTLRMLRASLADVADDYRWLDSGTRMQVTRKACNTRMRVLSSSGKRSLGLEGWKICVGDEPSAWEARGGELQFHSLRQAIGKRPGQRLLLCGTRAPAEPGSWWPSLIDGGSQPGVSVCELRAPDDAAWDLWPTIRACNPMSNSNPALRQALLRERDEARRSPTMRRSFEAFRLNRSVEVHSEVLVEAEDWLRVQGREVPPRKGRPIVGIDLGSERSWSASWCSWENGRSECYAVAPGIPSLEERERQDAQPRGLYRRLFEDGVLVVDEGLRVSRPETLINHLLSVGITPKGIVCDRFLLGSLKDAVRGRWPVVPRVVRWSEATEDIAAFRKLVADGPMSIVPECRALATVSLSGATVKSDDQGSCRLEKKKGNRSRDDVAVAATLASGALVRDLASRPTRRWRYRGAA